ncbi:oxidoreductase [Streptomyces lunaelactis]|uniref:Oxidoreductase n=1 Tax=Streptomyces lunaelactis TaxID=1535768 RepID=A0A2R4T6B5_9ACTN|nr:2-oxoglutarate and iron-dependent oxygenase domain-containing protein [Streptomyces lunaelactis]AVZ74636.1 oxidoreductase [Streptomyces lunaelactis]NUK86819.1 isopenicillin N synthase family oxygenase [Streptomyces lunaelactis]
MTSSSPTPSCGARTSVTEPRIPTIDLRPWFSGDPAARAEIAAAVDQALRTAGFLLVTGHGVDPDLRAEIREAAREFFRLPSGAKEPYAVKVGGRGWLGPGAEANGYAEGTETPPDLKESLSFAAEDPTGDPAVDAEWFAPNTWPAEAPKLKALVETYLGHMRALCDRLLELLGVALGESRTFFTGHTGHPTWGFNINWYPGTGTVGPPQPGQFRIGPHTDFGTVTVLDRQAGKGGLQVFTEEGGWENAPYDPAAFTINIGDLMARWTGDRWRSGRHRVLPPPADVPAEELISLVYFYECDPGTEVRGIDSHTYLRAQLDAITAG